VQLHELSERQAVEQQVHDTLAQYLRDKTKVCAARGCEGWLAVPVPCAVHRWQRKGCSTGVSGRSTSTTQRVMPVCVCVFVLCAGAGRPYGQMERQNG
jgi:hypothetical protein